MNAIKAIGYKRGQKRNDSDCDNDLTLRSIAKRCVSKGGNEHLACCPSFETRRFAALLRMR